MKKIWQTHILQDTKLKRKEIVLKSALTILFQIITKWNSTLNLIFCNRVKLGLLPYSGCQKNQITVLQNALSKENITSFLL